MEPGTGIVLLLIACVVAVVLVAYQPMERHLLAVSTAVAEADGDAAPSTSPVPVSALDVIYGCLQLFVFNLPPIDAVPLPVSLQWLRLLAPLIGVLSVVLLLSRLARAFFLGLYVRLWRGHEVICGTGESCVALARLHAERDIARVGLGRLGRGVIVVAPAVTDEARRALRRLRIPAVIGMPSPASGSFANAVGGARHVYVDLDADQDTVRYAVAALQVGSPKHTGSRWRGCGPAGRVTGVIGSSDHAGLSTLVNDPRLRLRPRWQRATSAALGVAGFQRGNRGPLHVVVIADTPQVETVIDEVLASARPAEEARITLLVRPGSRLEANPISRSKVTLVPVPTAQSAVMVLRLDRVGLESSPATGADDQAVPISGPVIVHLEDPLDQLMTITDLLDHTELGHDVVALQEPATAAATAFHSTMHDRGQRLRLVNPTSVGALGLFDGLCDDTTLAQLLRDSHRAWQAPELRGPHPVEALMSPLLTTGPAEDDAAGYLWVARRLDAALRTVGLSAVATDSGMAVLGPTDLRSLALQLRQVGFYGLRDDAPPSFEEPRGRFAALVELIALIPELLRVIGASIIPSERAADRFRPDEEQLWSLAREIHRSYLRKQDLSERPSTDAQVAWEQLGPVPRESNLAQARAIPSKLALLGLDLAVAGSPVPSWPTGVPDRESIDLLAELEHRRWCGDLLDRGYRYGAVRDRNRRVHNQLIPFEQLTGAEQDKDIETVLGLPDVTAGAGLQLVPIDDQSGVPF